MKVQIANQVNKIDVNFLKIKNSLSDNRYSLIANILKDLLNNHRFAAFLEFKICIVIENIKIFYHVRTI